MWRMDADGKCPGAAIRFLMPNFAKKHGFVIKKRKKRYSFFGKTDRIEKQDGIVRQGRERRRVMSMNIEQLLKDMTLEEKASLCSGHDFWHTKTVERLEIGRASCRERV